MNEEYIKYLEFLNEKMSMMTGLPKDEIGPNGVTVRGGDFTMYTSHKGYEELMKDVIKGLYEGYK